MVGFEALTREVKVVGGAPGSYLRKYCRIVSHYVRKCPVPLRYTRYLI